MLKDHCLIVTLRASDHRRWEDPNGNWQKAYLILSRPLIPRGKMVAREKPELLKPILLFLMGIIHSLYDDLLANIIWALGTIGEIWPVTDPWTFQ